MPAATETRIYTIVFMLAAAAGIGALALLILKPFLAAIAWAIAVAVVFHRPWTALERRLRKRRNLAAGLMCVGILIVVLLPAAMMGRLVAVQGVNLAGRVTTFLQTNRIGSFSDLAALPRVTGALDRLNRLAGISPDDFQAMAAGAASRASLLLASGSRWLIYGALDATVTFLMTIFLLFFLFRDGEAIGAAIVWAPGAAWLWVDGRHAAGIFLFIWGALVTSFAADNILKPILIGRSEEMSTLVVFLGVFGGLAAFGLPGVFIGPVTLALALTLIQVLRRQASPAAG
ncbi:MAG TPA: AI-2E family transporter [Candidatus Polarisedimenticolia bacterium]